MTQTSASWLALRRAYRVAWLGGGILLACLPLACSPTPPAPLVPPPAPVEVLHAWKEDLDEWAEFPGTTQPLPKHVARVTAAVEGTVLSVLPGSNASPAAAEGQRVQAGQVLVQLDDRIARDNRAKVEAAQKEVTPQKKQAENAVQLARDTARRLDKLRSGSSDTATPLVSNAELEKAQSALRDAEAQLQVVEAKQASGAAELQALDRQLRLYTLRAPIAGWLGTLQVVPGQTIAVGTTVAEIVDLDEIDVACFVPPSRVARLALGQPAQVVPADARPPDAARPPEGKVVYVAVQAAAETGSFEVKVRFPNQRLHLRANAVLQVRIRTEPPRERLVIPADALMENQEPPGVVVAGSVQGEKGGQVGKARVLQAVLGVRNRRRRLVEILSLEDPEKKAPVPPVTDAWFVVAGGHGLEDGDTVQVKEVPHPDEATQATTARERKSPKDSASPKD